YHWRVRAINATGNGEWSAAWQFTTEAEPLQAPAVTSLLAPTNFGTGVATNPLLSWAETTDAESYRVQVAADGSFTNPVFDQDGVTGLSVTAPNLGYSTNYH